MAYGEGQDGYDDDGNLWPPEYAKVVEERDSLIVCLRELCCTIEEDGICHPRVERDMMKAKVLIAKITK